MKRTMVSIALLLLLALTYGTARADDSHVMKKEQLRPLLGKPDLIIIDVRTNYDWDNSKRNIRGLSGKKG